MVHPDKHIRDSSFCQLVHLEQQLTREVTPDLQALGLNPLSHFVLGQVLLHPGCSPADLARECNLSPQHQSQLLARAEASGLVKRDGERGRGRRTRVYITALGVDLLERAWPSVRAVGEDRLTPGQHRVLQALMHRMGERDRDSSDVVVLVDGHGRDAGTADRLGVHTATTPLHRAFSVYLRDAAGRVLLTRRALHKATWPGVWSNAACGHLRPGETPEQAALRRVPEELGATPTDLRVVLPNFAYRATDASGIVENEVCPVLVGSIDANRLEPSPDEVCEVAWVGWDDLRRMAATTPFALSPWSVLQVQALDEDPWAASAGRHR